MVMHWEAHRLDWTDTLCIHLLVPHIGTALWTTAGLIGLSKIGRCCGAGLLVYGTVLCTANLPSHSWISV